MGYPASRHLERGSMLEDRGSRGLGGRSPTVPAPRGRKSHSRKPHSGILGILGNRIANSGARLGNSRFPGRRGAPVPIV